MERITSGDSGGVAPPGFSRGFKKRFGGVVEGTASSDSMAVTPKAFGDGGSGFPLESFGVTLAGSSSSLIRVGQP